MAVEKTKLENSTKYINGLGRRKTAVAQVRLYKKGSGKMIVNGLEMKDYFTVTPWQQKIQAPLRLVGMLDSADISVRTLGGGKRSQADAVSLGISRALVKLDETLRASLKAESLMTRDPRKKERKKPGLRKARKAPQWSKR